MLATVSDENGLLMYVLEILGPNQLVSDKLRLTTDIKIKTKRAET